MENKTKKALDDFVNIPQDDEAEPKDDKTKQVVINERDGLIIERVDKVFITKDGRQLLREWY